MEHYTGPLDFIGITGYSIDDVGVYKTNRKEKRYLRIRDDYWTTVSINSNHRDLDIRKLRYCTDNNVPYDSYCLHKLQSEPTPDVKRYPHYIGSLAHIGLPDYTMVEDGLIRSDCKNKIQRLYSSNHTFCINVGTRKRLRITKNKLLFAAEKGIPFEKIHTDHLIVYDGKLMTRSDAIHTALQKSENKAHDVIPTLSGDQYLQEIAGRISELNMLSAAVTSGDFSSIADYLIRFRDHSFRIIRKYMRGGSAKPEVIWIDAYDTAMTRIRKGDGHLRTFEQIIVSSTIGALYAEYPYLQRRREMRRQYTKNLHNEDDELPYQYD